VLALLALAPFAQVMILGTYHFADAGLDAVKTQLRDTKSSVRQAEILDIVKRLKAFRPTKIAIEATPDRADEINQRLLAYSEGNYTLSANEIDQLGFRIAKQCGVNQLTPIDSKLNLDFSSLMQFLGAHDAERSGRLGAVMRGVGKKFEDWDNRFSVGQMLAIHNSKTYIRESHRFYVSLCDATDGNLSPGADILGDWYKRNARIYGNLRRTIQKGDRVLVIYGSGHSKILRELVQDSGDLELVEASNYLPACPVPASEIRFIDGAE